MYAACKRFFFIVLIVGFPVLCQAQDGAWDINGKASKKVGGKVGKEKNKVKKFKDHLQNWGLDSNYKHGLLVGGKLNTNGWSGAIYYQTKLSPTQSSIWQLSFSEVKHDKQVKQENTKNKYPQFGKPTPFIFGKINKLYTLQIGYGREHVLLPNVVEDNLTVSFRWNAGISLALLKPYYLRLVYKESLPVDTVFMMERKYSNAISDTFLNNNNILGASKWSKGLGDMQYIPGIYVETAFVIEPAKRKSFVQVITLGFNGAFYTSDLPIMANTPAGNWQACLFAGLSFGKRWK